MAKKIRFPLKMKNGAEVRTIDELKENFDLESVLGYFTDGKLVTWLADRYYDEKAEAVSALSSDMSDLSAKLCEILEVEYQPDEDDTDLETIQRRNEKVRILCAVTDNQDVLNNIDLVAMSQDELFDILDEKPDKVYLYGEKFSIPFGAKDVNYIGVNQALIILETNKGIDKYEAAGIIFHNVRFEDNVNPYVSIGVKKFFEGKYKEAFPLIENEANNGNPRAMYIMALYYEQGFGTIILDDDKDQYWLKKGFDNNDPLAIYGAMDNYYIWADICREKEENGELKLSQKPKKEVNPFEKKEFGTIIPVDSYYKEELLHKIFEEIKHMADYGDIMSQYVIAEMYYNGNGVDEDEEVAKEYLRRSADQGFALAQVAYGLICDDYSERKKWIQKSADQECVTGQMKLAKSFSFAAPWKAKELYLKAAKQGEGLAEMEIKSIDKPSQSKKSVFGKIKDLF